LFRCKCKSEHGLIRRGDFFILLPCGIFREARARQPYILKAKSQRSEARRETLLLCQLKYTGLNPPGPPLEKGGVAFPALASGEGEGDAAVGAVDPGDLDLERVAEAELPAGALPDQGGLFFMIDIVVICKIA
jgi:hypothetical protein